MRNLSIEKKESTQGADYNKVVYNLNGSLASRQALELKKDITQWYNESATEYVIDLSGTTELDIVGINCLVKMKIIADEKNIRFSIRAPYSKNIVSQFENTKMEKALNVNYLLETRSLAA